MLRSTVLLMGVVFAIGIITLVNAKAPRDLTRRPRSIADRILFFAQPWGEDPWSHTQRNPCRLVKVT